MNHQLPVNKLRSILFVCTSNVCRGPMAAALFKRRRPVDCSCIVRSAGIEGTDGQPVMAVAQEVLHRRGIDLAHHAARIITPNLLPAFDIILAMEEGQREWIERNAPVAARRTWRLGHWRDLEITCRTNGHHSNYERLADEIEQCISDWNQRFVLSELGQPAPEVTAGTPGPGR